MPADTRTAAALFYGAPILCCCVSVASTAWQLTRLHRSRLRRARRMARPARRDADAPRAADAAAHAAPRAASTPHRLVTALCWSGLVYTATYALYCGCLLAATLSLSEKARAAAIQEGYNLPNLSAVVVALLAVGCWCEALSWCVVAIMVFHCCLVSLVRPRRRTRTHLEAFRARTLLDLDVQGFGSASSHELDRRLLDVPGDLMREVDGSDRPLQTRYVCTSLLWSCLGLWQGILYMVGDDELATTVAFGLSAAVVVIVFVGVVAGSAAAPPNSTGNGTEHANAGVFAHELRSKDAAAVTTMRCIAVVFLTLQTPSVVERAMTIWAPHAWHSAAWYTSFVWCLADLTPAALVLMLQASSGRFTKWCVSRCARLLPRRRMLSFDHAAGRGGPGGGEPGGAAGGGDIVFSRSVNRRLDITPEYAGILNDFKSKSQLLPPGSVTLVGGREGRVGRGGEGAVLKGVFGGVVVAVKELFPSFDYSAGGESLSDANAQRVLDEAKVLLRLRHPSIVNCFGIFDRHDPELQCWNLYIVMEMCAGGSLRDRLRLRRGGGGGDGSSGGGGGSVGTPSLAASAAIHVDWSRQLLSALQYLHALGPPLVVHLDVKPGNILLSGDGRQLRLCDFGSCLLLHDSSVGRGGGSISGFERRTPSQEGTLMYTAPEFICGEAEMRPTGAAAFMRWDVWSCGMVLTEVLTGEEPFQQYQQAWAIRQAVGRGERPFGERVLNRLDSLAVAVEHVPQHMPALCGLVQRMLSPSPGDRPLLAEVSSVTFEPRRNRRSRRRRSGGAAAPTKD